MIKNIKNRIEMNWKIILIDKNMKNNKSEPSDKNRNNTNDADIIVKIICDKKINNKGQLYSDLDALPLKLAQFLKKFFTALENEIIFSGLSEPEVKVSIRKLKEKIFFLFVENMTDLELKWGSMKL
tara:strand:- start:105 stop:482 length:378 start_codon:yes stop_codon:yes gene_type:complete